MSERSASRVAAQLWRAKLVPRYTALRAALGMNGLGADRDGRLAAVLPFAPTDHAFIPFAPSAAPSGAVYRGAGI
jgi:hypothetical protein